MKLIAGIVLVFCFQQAMAQDEIARLTGKWNGKLELPSGAVPFEIRLEANNQGGISGTLRNPEKTEMETPLADIALKAGEVTFTVGGTQLRYEGRVAGDGIQGNLIQGDSAPPLNFARGGYGPAILDIPEDAMSQLSGQWHGEFRLPGGPGMVVYRFETNAEGEHVAFVDMVEQGWSGMPVTNAVLDGDDLSFTVPAINAVFDGRISKGRLRGRYSIFNFPKFSISLEQGEFSYPYPLDLPADAVSRLEGSWEGSIRIPGGGTQRNILRFIYLEDGQFYCYLDNPDLAIQGMRISEAKLDDDVLRLKTVTPNAEFRGRLEGNKLTGVWTPPGARIQGEYEKKE